MIIYNNINNKRFKSHNNNNSVTKKRQVSNKNTIDATTTINKNNNFNNFSRKRLKLSTEEHFYEKSITENNNSEQDADELYDYYFDFQEKLRDHYMELMADDYNDFFDTGLKFCSRSFLLEHVVEREKLNTIVVNLYPGNKGYSLAFHYDDQQQLLYPNYACENGNLSECVANSDSGVNQKHTTTTSKSSSSRNCKLNSKNNNNNNIDSDGENGADIYDEDESSLKNNEGLHADFTNKKKNKGAITQ